MPRVIKSTTDRGLDEEIDRLWREIDALKSKTTPAQQQSIPVQTVIQTTPVNVTPVGAHWHVIGNI